MSTSSNHFGLNWVKIKSSTSDHSGFLTMDGNGTVNIDQINRFDTSYIPNVTGNGLNYKNIVPSTTTLEVGTSYTLVCLEFDGILGSSSTVTSSNGTLSSLVVADNCLQFSYQNNSTSDVLKIHAYSPDNTMDKWMNYTLNLTTVLAIPVSFVSAPNTKQYAYTGLQMNFNRPITALSGITSSSGATIGFITVVGGKVQFNYTTPNSATDTLTFQGVSDGITVNSNDVTFNLTGLLDGPTFSSFTTTPQSQSYSYTGLEANFNKTITTCTSISALNGTDPTNVSVSGGKVLFDWVTGAIASETLYFNGLVSSDGSLDGGAIESVVVTLSAPPSTPSWFANQPVLSSTAYTSQVAFNKTVASVGSVTSSGTNQPSNVSIVSGRVQFDITTDSNPGVTYTFNDIVASDGGILGSTTLTTGPSISSFLSNNNASVGNKVLIQTGSQSVAVTFSKNISNTPTATLNVGNAVYNSGSGTSTITYILTNVTASTNLMSFSNVIATDSTSSSGLTQSLSPVTVQTFNRVADQSAPLISKTTFDADTTYNLLSVFNKNISNDLTGVTVTASTGSNPSNLAYSSADRYSFDWTPDTSGSVTLNFNNVKDNDSFSYLFFSSPTLTVNAVFPIPIYDFDGADVSQFSLSGSGINSWTSNSFTFSKSGSAFFIRENSGWITSQTNRTDSVLSATSSVFNGLTDFSFITVVYNKGIKSYNAPIISHNNETAILWQNAFVWSTEVPSPFSNAVVTTPILPSTDTIAVYATSYTAATNTFVSKAESIHSNGGFTTVIDSNLDQSFSSSSYIGWLSGVGTHWKLDTLRIGQIQVYDYPLSTGSMDTVCESLLTKWNSVPTPV